MRTSTSRWLTATVFTALATAALLPLVAGPAQAATGCDVRYRLVGSWQSGFQGELAVTNTGSGWCATRAGTARCRPVVG